MNLDLLSRLRWTLRRSSLAIVLPALVGVLLLLAVAAAEQWLGAPLADAVDDIRHETQTLRSQAARRQRVDARNDPASQLTEFYDFFPAEESLVATLERIYAAAAHENLMLTQGDYRLAQDTEARLQRYDVVLPVKGRYGAIRRFIAQALKENPNLALTAVSFSRQSATEIGVDAQLQLALYLAAAP